MKPKLLLLTPLAEPQFGHWQNATGELASHLREDFVVANVKVPTTSVFSEALFAMGFLYQVLRGKMGVELVLASSKDTVSLAAIAGWLLGIPVIALVEESPDPFSWWQKKVFSPFLKKCDAVLVADKVLAASLKSFVPSQRVKTVQMGVDLPSEQSLIPRAKAKELLVPLLGENIGRRPMLVSFQNDRSRQDIANFATDTLPNLVKQFPEILYVIVGGDSVQFSTPHITKLSYADETASRLLVRAANALLFPQNQRSVLEANALGCPIVSTGPWVEEERNGVVAASTSEEIFGKLVFLLRRYQVRDWSFDCRDMVANESSWATGMPRIVDVLEAHRNQRFRTPGLIGLGAKMEI